MHLIDMTPATCLVTKAQCTVRSQLYHQDWLLVLCLTVMVSHQIPTLHTHRHIYIYIYIHTYTSTSIKRTSKCCGEDRGWQCTGGRGGGVANGRRPQIGSYEWGGGMTLSPLTPTQNKVPPWQIHNGMQFCVRTNLSIWNS